MCGGRYALTVVYTGLGKLSSIIYIELLLFVDATHQSKQFRAMSRRVTVTGCFLRISLPITDAELNKPAGNRTRLKYCLKMVPKTRLETLLLMRLHTVLKTRHKFGTSVIYDD